MGGCGWGRPGSLWVTVKVLCMGDRTRTANGWARATEASEGREPLRRGGAVRERSQTPLVAHGGIRYQLLRRIRFRMDVRSLKSQTPFVNWNTQSVAATCSYCEFFRNVLGSFVVNKYTGYKNIIKILNWINLVSITLCPITLIVKFIQRFVLIFLRGSFNVYYQI